MELTDNEKIECGVTIWAQYRRFTDRRTELLYQYRMNECRMMRDIKCPGDSEAV